MESNRERWLKKEAELKKRVEESKARIRKYPQNVQDEIEALMVANIIYNSEAIETDTLPKEEAIKCLVEASKSLNQRGLMFK